jgi:hypothetical protein
MRSPRVATFLFCTLLVGGLASCELMVQLDRSAAPEKDGGCPICGEAGADDDASDDAEAALDSSFVGDADAGGGRLDSSAGDGGSDAAVADAGAKEGG